MKKAKRIALFLVAALLTCSVAFSVWTPSTNLTSVYAETVIDQNEILNYELAQVGKGYSQTNRYAEDWFDCSSLIYRAYERYGIKLPLSTYHWYVMLRDNGITPGKTITFSGSGGTVTFQCVAMNFKAAEHPEYVSTPGTIMLIIEQGEVSGHVATSLGCYARQDGGLDPSSDAEEILQQTKSYVISQLAARYGANADLLNGVNPYTGAANTWMSSDSLGTDISTSTAGVVQDRLYSGDYSAAYNSVWRVEAYSTSTGVCVSNSCGQRNVYAALVPVGGTDDVNSDPPTIESAQVTNVTESGYDVNVTFNAPAGVSKVVLPTWTEANGQDDLVWHQASVSGSTASFSVKISDHNNESGKYITHVYVYDTSGRKAVVGLEADVPSKQSGVVYGDVNGDSDIDVFDMSMIYQGIIGSRTLTGTESQAADVNHDGEVDIFDLARIYQFIIGAISSLS